MKINDISYERLELELKEPYTIAYETISHCSNFILTIESDSGIRAYGCAAPDAVITRETADEVELAIQDIIIPALRGSNPFHYARLLEELSAKLKSSALAMVDLALFDMVSKSAGVPLYQFLGGYRESISTSITIGIMHMDDTMRKAKEYINQGFNIIKLKGGIDVEGDIKKIARLRELYPYISLRFDGNQGYQLDEALHFVRETKPYTIEILEQPTSVKSEELMGVLSQNITIPVMADESLKTLQDVFRLTKNDLTDMINIKIMKVGGIWEALHINSVAKSAKNEVMVGCLDECALGISAGLHFALSRPNVEYADLDGHLDFINDPFRDLFTIKDGVMYPGTKPGLGL